MDGKGQFICGNKKCNEDEGLRSWEVNFAYMEHGEKKNALVKLSEYIMGVLILPRRFSLNHSSFNLVELQCLETQTCNHLT